MRPASRGAQAGAALEAAERDAHDGQAGVVQRPRRGRRERQLVAARKQPRREAQQPDLRAARVGDGTHGEDPHGRIVAGHGWSRGMTRAGGAVLAPE